MRVVTARGVLLLGVIWAIVVGGLAAAQTPKAYPLPGLTTWLPVGCRGVPYVDATTPAGTIWGNLHGNGINSDEVSHALAPVFHEAWTAETATYNVTGPVFDSAGNLYFAPLRPHENVVLVSIDAATGARRWAIPGTGAPPGSSAPLVLRDPDHTGQEIVYLALKNRVLAVRTDGQVVWDVPSGLALGSDPFEEGVLGTNHLPVVDAIIGLARDGHLFAVDRRTGAPVLNAPYQFPGEATPPGTAFTLPPALVSAAEDLLQVLVDVSDGGLQRLVWALLGNDAKVANMFSVDPRTGRLWVAATAPDAEDGTVDGVSELGALFRLELIPSGGGYDVVEVCHRSFAGGSASTPTLSHDGSRIYLGDNFGKLLAVKDDCTDAWELDLGAQIFGSVSVPADNREIYASTASFIAKVIDDGAIGTLEWTATIDPFEGLAGGQVNFNLNLVTAAANGLAFQSGAGVVLNGTPLPAAVGVGIIDRGTGLIRSFAAGGEETVAVMSIGPDGAMYIGNSPVRRLFGSVLGLSPAPIRGGITKFEPDRFDLVLRDAVCASEARATNALANYPACADAARADARQLRELAAQSRSAGARALAAGELTAKRWVKLDRRLGKADARLAAAELAPTTGLRRGLRTASRTFRRICATLD